MKKVATFLILFLLLVGKVFAQNPVVTPSGPMIPDYYVRAATNTVLVNNENNLLSHHVRASVERLFLYGKGKQSLKIQELIIPNKKEIDHLFSKAIGNEVITYYYAQPKKSNQFILTSATVPQDASTPNRNLNLKKFFSINLGEKESVLQYVAVSPDNSKYAFCFIVLDRKNTMKKFMIMVFDDKGEIEWQENYNPDFSDKEVNMYDFQLTDDGKILLLVLSSSGKRKDVPTLQLMSFHENEQITMDEEVPAQVIQSMKVLALSNGNYFVGGYYAEKKGTTVGYFNMIFDPRSETLLSKKFHRFNEDYFEKGFLGWGNLAFTNQMYDVSCNYLFELDNGSVAMLGEQHRIVVVYSQKGPPSYRYFRKHIICNMFSLEGDKEGYEMVKRSQALVSGRFISDVSQYGLSFSPVIKGSDIYLLYNDNIRNFNGKAKNWETINMNRPKMACTILAKISKIGNVERKVIMLPNKDKRILHKLWAFDGETAVFGIMSNKLYSIEKFEVNDQWSWD